MLGNTPITFPIEWASSKIPGYAVRASMPNFHGLSAFVVFSSVAARFFEPQVSGIGATPPGGGHGVFRIDHDESFNATTHLQYQPSKNRTMDQLQLALRQRTGGWASAVRRRQLREWPERDRFHRGCFRLTPDQQFEAGLYLRQRVCDAHHADQSYRSLSGIAIWIEAGKHPCGRHRERRP